MKILAAQMNPIIGDLKGNTLKIIDAIKRGQQAKVDVVVFSELALSGYPPEDFLLVDGFLEANMKALEAIIPSTKGISAIIGIPKKNPNLKEKGITNSAAVIHDGKLLGFQDKCLLPTYDVFDEKRYFEPGGNTKIWSIAGKKVGITICEDLWEHSDLLQFTSYHRDPVLELQALKPDVMLNLSASPYSEGRVDSRIDVCTKAAKTLRCPVIFCNQVGGNDSLVFDGYSIYVGSNGDLLQIAAGFKEDDLLVDTEQKSAPLNFHDNSIEDLYKALTLGLHDYFKKSGFEKACLGLSGGIDSALVASIAADALGPKNILGVLMPSRYSSQGSIVDAEHLAKNLGIEYITIPIEEPFDSYLHLLGPFFKDKKGDVTEENLQARIRGMILMALSNKHGYIVLSTGNKSEMAMGYATLYGDMCGGLGVINDVTKTQVYTLSKWVNRNREIIPWNTIEKPPSAELRPNQKDSDSLPDYEIVDTVLQDYIVSHLSPDEISKRHNYPLELVQELIKKIHRNEYKRRQAPPGIRVSEKAFSVGRRFPIVQKWCQ